MARPRKQPWQVNQVGQVSLLRQGAQVQAQPEGTHSEPARRRRTRGAVPNLPRQDVQERGLPERPHEQETQDEQRRRERISCSQVTEKLPPQSVQRSRWS